MSYSMKYPVDFRSGGDSVKEAFGKHIEEFRTVYGALNELAGNDLTAAEKEELKTGSINGSRIIGAIAGTISGENITGSVSGSKITGSITGATIHASKVTGLDEYIDERQSESGAGSENYGITESQKSANGYMKFGNGLTVQWGSADSPANVSNQAITFPKAFTTACYAVMITAGHSNADWPKYGYDEKYPGLAVLTDTLGLSGFTVARGPNTQIAVRIYYIAIGA